MTTDPTRLIDEAGGALQADLQVAQGAQVQGFVSVGRLAHLVAPTPSSHNRRTNVFTGITTDVCVHTTLREATDRGFDCLLLEDCCAATVASNHAAALSMIKQEGGYFGCVSTSSAFTETISRRAL